MVEIKQLKIGINASRARSGGGVAHLVGILGEVNPTDFGVSEVHVWSYKTLLASLPTAPWLIKHSPPELDKSLLRQMWWEKFSLIEELHESGCSILLNVDAGSVCRFHPSVTMSRDMLSYERGEIERYGISMARLRLIALRYIQNASLKSADGVIFLTQYAGNLIQESCGLLTNIAHVPHGVGDNFKVINRELEWPALGERPINCLYISNANLYKHQWHVVKAIEIMRNEGLDVRLTLVGGGSGKGRVLLDEQIRLSDPHHKFVTQKEFVSHENLPQYLAESDIFVFASSCENMPNTLVEAMASGVPIACSNRGPMPEVLCDGGVYFDPENPQSVACSVKKIIDKPKLRQQCSTSARKYASQYSWSRCAKETWKFMVKTYDEVSR